MQHVVICCNQSVDSTDPALWRCWTSGRRMPLESQRIAQCDLRFPPFDGAQGSMVQSCSVAISNPMAWSESEHTVPMGTHWDLLVYHHGHHLSHSMILFTVIHDHKLGYVAVCPISEQTLLIFKKPFLQCWFVNGPPPWANQRCATNHSNHGDAARSDVSICGLQRSLWSHWPTHDQNGGKLDQIGAMWEQTSQSSNLRQVHANKWLNAIDWNFVRRFELSSLFDLVCGGNNRKLRTENNNNNCQNCGARLPFLVLDTLHHNWRFFTLEYIARSRCLLQLFNVDVVEHMPSENS